jgi:trehalose 6-phosphate synthase/phosphatase
LQAAMGFCICERPMNEFKQQRLVIVSNRLPFTVKGTRKNATLQESDGGLVSALKSYFENNLNANAFESTRWLGTADFSEEKWKTISPRALSSLTYEVDPLFIEKKTYKRFYNGFCNATIWPLFHYFPSFVEYDEETFNSYEQVNRIFANHVIADHNINDQIWIHDYQLMLVPGMVREQLPDATIGFFLHIPFPSFEVFRLLHKTWKHKIISGLLGADLIGFHTHEYVQHFLKTVRMIKGYDHQFRAVYTSRGMVKVDMFPIGIDFRKFHQAIDSQEVIELKEKIRNNFPGKKIIFSVDRLDYTKGITHRLAGFECFLANNPHWQEKIVFILVVVPSRQIVSKYNERKKLIEEEIGRINGKYSTLQWQPIIYRYNQLTFHELTALYNASDIGLLTPLRDGMNLVAKEYIASCKKHGVLILSELAGAASELSEAILVNPLDKNEVSQALGQALSMSIEEQDVKIQVMQQRLQTYEVIHWINDFVKQLEESKLQQQSFRANFLSVHNASQLNNAFLTAKRKLLLLDYDGTLVPYSRNPQLAVPGEQLLDLLRRLSADSETDVAIVSGRDHATLERWFGKLNLNLVSEHGVGVKLKGHDWQFNATGDQNWKHNFLTVLQTFAQRSPGAFIEEKPHTLVWHYRNVDGELGFVRSRELLDTLNHLIHNLPLHIVDGNKVIEIRSNGIDKGTVVAKLLGERPYDFVMAIGDDKTDEDMFRVLYDFAYTIKVGEGNTMAKYNLKDHHQVIQLLQQLQPATIDT